MPAFPTLSRNPSYPIDPDGVLEDMVIRSDPKSGYEQTRPRFTRARRSFGVNYVGLDAADEALLRAFEITTLRNGADSFTWTHPISGAAYTVRLSGGSIKWSRSKGKASGVVNASMQLREV